MFDCKTQTTSTASGLRLLMKKAIYLIALSMLFYRFIPFVLVHIALRRSCRRGRFGDIADNAFGGKQSTRYACCVLKRRTSNFRRVEYAFVNHIAVGARKSVVAVVCLLCG